MINLIMSLLATSLLFAVIHIEKLKKEKREIEALLVVSLMKNVELTRDDIKEMEENEEWWTKEEKKRY